MKIIILYVKSNDVQAYPKFVRLWLDEPAADGTQRDVIVVMLFFMGDEKGLNASYIFFLGLLTLLEEWTTRGGNEWKKREKKRNLINSKNRREKVQTF